MSEENNATPAPPPSPPQAAPPAAPQVVEGLSAEAKQWAMFAHLSALIGLVLPFCSLLGPLIVWQMKKAEFPFVDDQGKEALNFQITVAIAMLVSVLLMLVVIGILLAFVVGIGAIVFTVIGGIKANNGETYRYPMTLRLIK